MKRRLVGLIIGALFAVTLDVRVVAAQIEPDPGDPDLVVLSLTGPGPLVVGQLGTVSVTVKNQGALTADLFSVAIYKHRPTAPEPGTVGDVNCDVSFLAPGGTTTCTGAVSYSAAGTYSLWAQVDVRDWVFEANESNNVAGPQSVTVSPVFFTLIVTQAGSGAGTVASSPGGIACGWDCGERYEAGTVVTLTATPALGSVFAGWSGDGCSGVAGCTVTMERSLIITAAFNFTIPLSFAAPGNFTVGSFPRAVAIGDVDRDGRLDLAVANQGSHTVSILRGNGAGGFGAATHFAVGSEPVSVALGDLDGDGRLDLAVANQGSHTVSILRGNGAGGFGAATHFAVGTSPQSVAVGDLNRDGFLDLAVANYWSDNVSILLGDGFGGFRTATHFVVGLNPLSVALGDLNGDGFLDLAVARNSSTVSILLGDGFGGFGTATPFPVGPLPFSVALGDVDRDGRLDLAVANWASYTGTYTVSILRGDGAGGFGAATHFAVGANPTSVALGYLNGDGLVDLAVANSSWPSSGVSVLIGMGGGAFAGGRATNFATGSGQSVAIGDFNRDGKPDVAVANAYPDGVSILLNTTPYPGPALAVSPDTVPRGATVTVSWGGIAAPTTRDWIGLFSATDADTGPNLRAWSYANTCTQLPNDDPNSVAPAGSCSLTLPNTLPAGTYQLRLFTNDSFTRLAVTDLTRQ